MKKNIFTVLAFIVIINVSAQTKTYQGAWFSAKYPASFIAKGSMQSATDQEGFDSAIFTSPDGKVEFYVFAPQWGGSPTDIKLKHSEKMGDRKQIKSNGKIITLWTIYAKNGSYSRSYQETKNELGNDLRVVGIKYKSIAAYKKYKNDYKAFKQSIQQFAD